MYGFVLYISLFLVSSFTASRYANYCRKRTKLSWYAKVLWFILIVFPVILFSSFRYGIGRDYDNYIKMFNLYLQSGIKEYLFYFNSSSVGTIALIELGKDIFGTAQGILCLYSLITIILLVLSVLYYKDRIDIFTGMMMMYILLFPASLNTIRQMLAVAIIMYGLRYLEKRKNVLFFICVIIATLVHNTALVCVVLYFVYNKSGRLRKLQQQILSCLILLAPIGLVLLFSFGARLPFIGFLFENYSISFNVQYWVDLVIRLIIYVPLVKHARQDILEDGRNKIFYYMALMDLEFVITSFIFQWAYRFTYFTAFSQVVLVGIRIKKCVKNRGYRIIKYLAIYLLIFGMLYCLWERDSIVPYDTIFNHGISIWR